MFIKTRNKKKARANLIKNLEKNSRFLKFYIIKIKTIKLITKAIYICFNKLINIIIIFKLVYNISIKNYLNLKQYILIKI
jgi:hypothetical protein